MALTDAQRRWVARGRLPLGSSMPALACIDPEAGTLGVKRLADRVDAMLHLAAADQCQQFVAEFQAAWKLCSTLESVAYALQYRWAKAALSGNAGVELCGESSSAHMALYEWGRAYCLTVAESLAVDGQNIRYFDIPGKWQDIRAELTAVDCRRDGVALLIDAEAAELMKERAQGANCFVTLLQMAGIVNRDKKTLQRLYDAGDLPAPDVEGGKGMAHEWRWESVRPVLERKYSRKLPPVFPADKFARS